MRNSEVAGRHRAVQQMQAERRGGLPMEKHVRAAKHPDAPKVVARSAAARPPGAAPEPFAIQPDAVAKYGKRALQAINEGRVHPRVLRALVAGRS